MVLASSRNGLKAMRLGAKKRKERLAEQKEGEDG